MSLIKPFGTTLFATGLWILAANAAWANEQVYQEEVVVATALAQGANKENTPLAELMQEFGEVVDFDNAKNQTTPNVDIIKNSSAQATAHQNLLLNEPVVDAANILTAEQKTYLGQQLYKIYQDGLAQAAIVIVPTTEQMPIFDYAMAVADRWQLGDKQIDNGVLIVVAINDRKVQILSGYGLEGVLPDVILNRIIIEQIQPAFRQGDYAQGLSAAVARIDERLRADPEVLAQADKLQAQPSNDEPIDVIGLFIFAFIAGVFLSQIIGRWVGSTIGAIGFMILAIMAGISVFFSIASAVILWLFVCFAGVFSSLANVRTNSSGGGFRSGGRGGFGGGSFGSGGFGGGGGSFGGGGAGGSW